MTEAQKEHLFRKSLRSPEMTQVQLARWAKKKFNLSYVPNQPSISNLLSKYRRKRPSSSDNSPARKCILTEAQRNAIYMQKLRFPGLTQSDLARWAQETFSLPRTPNQPTISLILTKRRRLHNHQ
ncbi:MAG: hypothetical protein K2Q09_04580 [Phycisphaerales bacterium]|nr:hypothetical protein [Phycisphaerales bacterium]